ncbi:MAG: Bile acid:sodium symporter [Pedosphaera sp.]|nr:Bile acid:sodium symporter [Pedosphaera sp.]
MAFDSTTAIRLLTMISLGGLLFAVGLRLSWAEVVNSTRGSRLAWVLPANFILVPALTLAMIRVFGIQNDIAVGMLLLAAAPFAPVVPIFTRMARGDLALAGALTALFPFVSAVLTPLLCKVSLRPVLGSASLKFNFLAILAVLFLTITLPLIAGVAFNRLFPAFSRKLLRPLEIISEAAGACSLIFVTVVEFHTIVTTGWQPLVAMVVIGELSLLAGYALGGPSIGARRVIALGTANRNIALALLVAIQSFPHTPIVGAVIANGLVLIFLGLLHVAFWRYLPRVMDRQ